MSYILVILTVVAAHGQGSGNYYTKEVQAWRPIGEFHSAEMCVDAAKELNRPVGTYKCLRNK